jgi:HSP20 family protein
MYSPQIDVCERADEIVILVELPGIDRKDVQITWTDNVLTISGNKKRQPVAGLAQYTCVERSYGPFRREIRIGVPIDHKKAKAELREGLMKIRLPKVAEDGERNSIPIE